MKLEITGRHVGITEAVAEHAEKRAQKLAAEFPNIESIRIVLNVEKYRRIVEIVVQARKHLHVEALESSTDMYASIDAAADKVEKRLRKRVDKRKDHKSRHSLSEMERKIEGSI